MIIINFSAYEGGTFAGVIRHLQFYNLILQMSKNQHIKWYITTFNDSGSI